MRPICVSDSVCNYRRAALQLLLSGPSPARAHGAPRSHREAAFDRARSGRQSKGGGYRRAHDGTGPQGRRPLKTHRAGFVTPDSAIRLDLGSGSPRDASSRTGFDHLGEKCARRRMRLQMRPWANGGAPSQIPAVILPGQAVRRRRDLKPRTRKKSPVFKIYARPVQQCSPEYVRAGQVAFTGATNPLGQG